MRFLLLALLAGMASASTLTFTYGDDPPVVTSSVPGPENNVFVFSGSGVLGFDLSMLVRSVPDMPTSAFAQLQGFMTITGGTGDGTIQWTVRKGGCPDALIPLVILGCTYSFDFPTTFTFGVPVAIGERLDMQVAAFPGVTAGISIDGPIISAVMDSSEAPVDATIYLSGTIASPEPSTSLPLLCSVLILSALVARKKLVAG